MDMQGCCQEGPIDDYFKTLEKENLDFNGYVYIVELPYIPYVIDGHDGQIRIGKQRFIVEQISDNHEYCIYWSQSLVKTMHFSARL